MLDKKPSANGMKSRPSIKCCVCWMWIHSAVLSWSWSSFRGTSFIVCRCRWKQPSPCSNSKEEGRFSARVLGKAFSLHGSAQFTCWSATVRKTWASIHKSLARKICISVFILVCVCVSVCVRVCVCEKDGFCIFPLHFIQDETKAGLGKAASSSPPVWFSSRRQSVGLLMLLFLWTRIEGRVEGHVWFQLAEKNIPGFISLRHTHHTFRVHKNIVCFWWFYRSSKQ